MPTVGKGVGNPQSSAHAPNENILIEDFVAGIKHMLLLFERFGHSGA